MASTAVALSSTAVAMASAPKDLSAKANSFSTSASSLASLSLRRQSSRTALRRPFAVTASASKEDSSAQNFAATLALAAVIASTPLAVAPLPASADVAGLTPCKESKAFAKREKQEIKKLQSRLKNYSPESAPALAINATIEKTKRRFDFYGKQGLLCGTDGLPHLIVDGDQAHLGEFVYPGILFLYIAGWIGWVGRSYLIQTRTAKKPTEKEIIIDVPLATKLIWRGFIWPLAAISEFRNGKLVEDAANITVSPR